MKKLLILIFIVSCASPNSNITSNNVNFDFNDHLSFEEFNQLLIKYAETSPYPEIDE